MRSIAIVTIGLWLSACGGEPTGQDTDTEEGTGGGETAEGEAPPRLLSDEEAAQAQAQAMRTHSQARQVWDQCTESGDRSACDQAQMLYGIAADTWGTLVGGRPGDEMTPEWRFMHGQALFGANRYEQAGDVFDRYFDEGIAEQWRALAAKLAVIARERALGNALHSGEATRRTEPPQVSGEPPVPVAVEMPAAVMSLFRARQRFLEVVPVELDDEDLRRGYALENAKLLYFYGAWEQARPALTGVLDEGCVGERAWSGGRTAWTELRNMALALGQFDAVVSLTDLLGERSCTFGSDEPVDCVADGEHPVCVARSDAITLRLRGARRFLDRAEHAREEERREFAGRAGDAFLAALEQGDEVTPFMRAMALSQAAAAFVMAENAERVAAVDERVLREVELDVLEGADRDLALHALATSLMRRVEATHESGDQRAFMRLVARMLSSELDLPDLAADRERARVLIALTHEARRRPRDAAAAWTAVADHTGDDGVRRDARFKAAMAHIAARDCRRGTEAIQAYVGEYREADGARDTVVRGLWEVAQCVRRRQPDYLAALQSVLDAATSVPGTLSSEARNQAAEAAFTLVDPQFASLEAMSIALPAMQNVEEATNLLRDLAGPAETRAGELLVAYGTVEALNDPEWTVAAALRSGQVIDKLIQIILGTRWELPADIVESRRHLTAYGYSEVRQGVEARIREILETKANPLRCRAAGRFDQAVRLSRSSNIQSDHARRAVQALEGVDADILTRCRQRHPELFRD